jgi:hypothetical protein
MMTVSVRIIAGIWLWQKLGEQVEVTKRLKRGRSNFGSSKH